MKSSRIFESQPVGGVVAERDEAEVEQHLGDAPLVHEVDDDRRERALLDARVVVVVDADAGQVDGEEHHADAETRARQQADQLWLR